MLVRSNRFGWCIGGRHSLLKENTKNVIQHVTIVHVKNVKINAFYEMKAMGVECTPKCGSCQCRKCPMGGKQQGFSNSGKNGGRGAQQEGRESKISLGGGGFFSG